MRPGDVIADRFETEVLTRTGGMGEVWRARDRLTGAPVALKLLHGEPGEGAERFAREARVLAEMSHPRIVRYVAHGTTTAGEPWLAMEWLEGEDLGARLSKGAISLGETFVLVRRIAEGLAAAHARGLIHRDVKPSNVFLPAGDFTKAKLLDFGIARLVNAAALTRTGAQVGTPGYMAPEQARGERDVDARADVFALGCVLYRCVTGVRPFDADDPVAMMARVLFEDPPRIHELRPSAPADLDALVARMLAKHRDARPADGGAVLAELDALVDIDATRTEPEPEPGPRARSITTGEKRLVSVVLARDADSVRGELAHVAAAHGARLEVLADGSAIAMLSGTRAATDQAAQAARCALAVRAIVPRVALATGRSEAHRPAAIGDVVERAAHLLGPADEPASGVRLDELTAGLLDPRFEVIGDAAPVLSAERDATSATRTLLGKPTPCVGRERELVTLRAVWDECVNEEVARAVVVAGAAGVGKSRLRYEFVRSIDAADGAVQVWIARGDALGAGSPFGMLGQAVRRAVGLVDGEPLPARREKLAARVAKHFTGRDSARVSEFLGELAGTPFPEDDSALLRNARQDPMLMGDQMRRAWEDWVHAECRATPVLLILEDLHWGDLPTVSYVDAALRTCADAPFMVLGIGRPNVADVFPRLWSERGVQSMPLGPLTKRAAEKLARAALAGAEDDLVARIVARADGNAFFLEELIRSVAEGRGEALPDTVVAMVQARLEGLEPEPRRVLRAASVFGHVFWRGAVSSLLGGAADARAVGEWLDELCAREIVTRRSETRFPGEDEYVFRHTLVRDAAYAMLTEEDRALGHDLAGAWLEHAGEMDPMALAEHFERGGERTRALAWYRRAAENAFEGHDHAAAIARAERAIASGAAGEERGALRALQMMAHIWRGEAARGAQAGEEAVTLLPRRSPAWWRAMTSLVSTCLRTSEIARAEAHARAMLGEVGEPVGPHEAIACALSCRELHLFGRHALGEELLARVGKQAEPLAKRDPMVAGPLHAARAIQAAARGDTAVAARLGEAAVASFEAAGDYRLASSWRLDLATDLMELGAYARADNVLREAQVDMDRMGLLILGAVCRLTRALIFIRRGQLDQARAMMERVDDMVQGEPRHLVITLAQRAELERRAGQLDLALDFARRAVEIAEGLDSVRVYALTAFAEVLRARGEHEAAVDAATRATSLLDAVGGVDEVDAEPRLAYAEALHGAGDLDGARRAIAAARDRLLARAAKFTDDAWRASFLENVEAHARTLALARAWGA